MKYCFICHSQVKEGMLLARTSAFVEHFYPIDFSELREWRVLKGTYSIFGLRAALTLVSPLLNTILNWKYRKHHLVFPEGMDKGGCSL
jgi:hypothetical protein